MKSSTLFKIGFSGIGISVFSGFIPLLVAAFGNEALSQRMGSYLDELTLSTVLLLSTALIILGIKRKGQERHRAESKVRAEKQT